jgi:hypothetical protein
VEFKADAQRVQPNSGAELLLIKKNRPRLVALTIDASGKLYALSTTGNQRTARRRRRVLPPETVDPVGSNAEAHEPLAQSPGFDLPTFSRSASDVKAGGEAHPMSGPR